MLGLAAQRFAFATAVAQGSSHVYHNVRQQTRLRLRTSTRVARASKSVVATVVDEAVVMGLGLEFWACLFNSNFSIPGTFQCSFWEPPSPVLSSLLKPAQYCYLAICAVPPKARIKASGTN